MVMEKISAYLDGEAAQFEAAQTLRGLRAESSAREAWDLYHRIGDAVRGDPLLAGGFTARVMAQLADEPVVLAPRRLAPRMTRYALSAAASLAGVAVVLGVAFRDELVPGGPQLAEKPVQSRPATLAQNEPTVRQVNDLLAAHQDYASGSTINALGAYVRPVATLDTAAAERR
jgi:sigma-E factor negative regulatory protein RseA